MNYHQSVAMIRMTTGSFQAHTRFFSKCRNVNLHLLLLQAASLSIASKKSWQATRGLPIAVRKQCLREYRECRNTALRRTVVATLKESALARFVCAFERSVFPYNAADLEAQQPERFFTCFDGHLHGTFEPPRDVKVDGFQLKEPCPSRLPTKVTRTAEFQQFEREDPSAVEAGRRKRKNGCLKAIEKLTSSRKCKIWVFCVLALLSVCAIVSIIIGIELIDDDKHTPDNDKSTDDDESSDSGETSLVLGHLSPEVRTLIGATLPQTKRGCCAWIVLCELEASLLDLRCLS